MLKLDSVTLLGVDCVDIDRLILAAEICQKEMQFADVKLLTSIGTSNNPHIVPIKPITSTEEYSKFIISELDKYVETEHVLIIQFDGFILNTDAWSDDFLKYDYIGAPWFVADWSVKDFGFPKELLGTLVVGNGGFSLRSKKFIALSAQMYNDGAFAVCHPEDVVLAVHHRKKIEKKGIRFAPVELAQQFSYEAKDEAGNNLWDGQFGFHGLRWTDISKWLNKHPQYPIDNSIRKVN